MKNKFKIKEIKILLLLLFFFFFNVTLASDINTDNSLLLKINQIDKNKNIELNFEKKPILDILLYIQKQTGLQFSFEEGLSPESMPLFTIKDRDIPLDRALKILFYNTAYSFKYVEDAIIIYKVNNNIAQVVKTDTQPEKKLSKINVKGKIIDEDNNPIIGATVMIANTNDGSITDENGLFIIKANVGSVLEVNFIGKETITKVITDKDSNITLKMKTNAIEVEEVVVNGIVTRKAESYTGSAVTLKAEDLKRVGNKNIIQSLKYLDPSINIKEDMKFGSDPNKVPEMSLRGGTSFSAADTDLDKKLKADYKNKPNQPLFILDGFEVSSRRVFDIDMNRVESLTILKDASAKALYGSKAANGVVVIETKKIRATKPKFSYTGSFDLSMPDLSSYNMCNSIEKLEVEFREGLYDVDNRDDMQRYSDRLKQAHDGLLTDWMSKPLRTGYSQRHSLNMEVGKEDIRAEIGLSMNDDKGVMKGSGRFNFSGNANVIYNYKKLKIHNSLSFTKNNSTDSPFGYFSDYVRLNPYEKFYDDNNEITKKLSDGTANPYYNGIIGTKLETNYTEILENLNVEYRFNNALQLRARFNATFNNSGADRYYPLTHTKFNDTQPDKMSQRGDYEMNVGKSTSLSGDATLNYYKTIGKHHISGNIGFNISQRKYNETSFKAIGFPSDKMDNISFALQYPDRESYGRPWGYGGFTRDLGALLLLSYDYDNKYLLDLTGRVNGSSVFGTDNRWAKFWSIGLGWNINRENFLKDVSSIQQLKLRMSMGPSGNQNFQNNKSIAIYKYSEDRYMDMVGATPENMENPLLKWERKMDYNIGLDAMIKDFYIRFDYYIAITQDMVTTTTIVPSTGFRMISSNIGKVNNKGFDLYLSYTPIRNSNSTLSFTTSLSHNKNKIVKISDAMKAFNDSQILSVYTEPPRIYKDDYDMETIWAVPSLGIDPQTGNEVFRKKNGMKTFIWDPRDIIDYGSSNAKIRGNFGFNGEYRGLGINVTFTFQAGGYSYNSTLVNQIENSSIRNNLDKRVYSDRWQKPGQESNFTISEGRSHYLFSSKTYDNTSYESRGWTRPTSRFIQKNNELNLSSLSIYYELNDKALKKIGFDNLRLSAYMNDVLKFSSIDIERGTWYPFARTISFSISATF